MTGFWELPLEAAPGLSCAMAIELPSATSVSVENNFEEVRMDSPQRFEFEVFKALG
jgi:hypothetical protein